MEEGTLGAVECHRVRARGQEAALTRVVLLSGGAVSQTDAARFGGRRSCSGGSAGPVPGPARHGEVTWGVRAVADRGKSVAAYRRRGGGR
jgi:hypothetical protein